MSLRSMWASVVRLVGRGDRDRARADAAVADDSARSEHRVTVDATPADAPAGRLPRARRGPMRTVYADAVVHETFTFKARVLQRAARLVFKPVLRHAPLNDRALLALRSLDKLSTRGPRSRFVEPVAFDLGGVPVESMTHRYGPNSGMTVLYLHGGGFFSCSIDTHRRICERLALLTGATVVSVDYRQLPEVPVAGSVDDAITAYAALVDMLEDPEKIVVAGDSAGGYLTMKIAELADRRGLPAPAAMLMFSPLLSLDPENEGKGVKRVIRVRDAYLPPTKLPMIRKRWLPEGSTIEGEASPFDAVDHIHSPAFFVAVEDEMLRPEVEAMAVLLAERDLPVEIHLWRGQVHAFPVLADLLPEARQALTLAADFARRAVGESSIVDDRAAASRADQHAEEPSDESFEKPVVGEIVPESGDSSEGPEVIDVEPAEVPPRGGFARNG